MYKSFNYLIIINRSLKNLDISCNEIESLQDLRQCKDLETLDFSSNKINNWFEIVSLIFVLIYFLKLII